MIKTNFKKTVPTYIPTLTFFEHVTPNTIIFSGLIVLLISKGPIIALFLLNTFSVLTDYLLYGAVGFFGFGDYWISFHMVGVFLRRFLSYWMFYTLFHNERFFCTQPVCCLTFYWTELKMLLRSCFPICFLHLAFSGLCLFSGILIS